MKEKLDKLVKKYETEDFIKDDPVQFPHRFKNKKDVEIAGFISSLLAFGKRELFIKKLNDIFNLMEGEPYNFLKEADCKCFKGFLYRFIKDEDFISLIYGLNCLYYKDNSNLEELFTGGIQKVCDYFCGFSRHTLGFNFMMCNPKNGGACKRYNMFLRWMIRSGPVDLGVWDIMKPSELMIPLDTHVARLSREYGFLNRKSNDIKAVIELTNKLKEFDPSDPIKYDFALFGLGVNQQTS